MRALLSKRMISREKDRKSEWRSVCVRACLYKRVGCWHTHGANQVHHHVLRYAQIETVCVTKRECCSSARRPASKKRDKNGKEYKHIKVSV